MGRAPLWSAHSCPTPGLGIWPACSGDRSARHSLIKNPALVIIQDSCLSHVPAWPHGAGWWKPLRHQIGPALRPLLGSPGTDFPDRHQSKRSRTTSAYQALSLTAWHDCNSALASGVNDVQGAPTNRPFCSTTPAKKKALVEQPSPVLQGPSGHLGRPHIQSQSPQDPRHGIPGSTCRKSPGTQRCNDPAALCGVRHHRHHSQSSSWYRPYARL